MSDPSLRAEIEALRDDLRELSHRQAIHEAAKSVYVDIRRTLDAILANTEEARPSPAPQGLRLAYHERDQVVAALSKLFPSHLCIDPSEPDWPIVCIHSPTGQLTWHVKAEERGLFSHLEEKPNHWDGHTTEEKYARLSSLPTKDSGALRDELAMLFNAHAGRPMLYDSTDQQQKEAWEFADAAVTLFVNSKAPTGEGTAPR